MFGADDVAMRARVQAEQKGKETMSIPMLIPALLALPAASPLPQGNLYDFKAVSRPEFPVLSAPSANGNYIFQVHGTEIVVLSAQAVKDCAAGTGSCDLDDLNKEYGTSTPLSRTTLDVTILDLEERNEFLYLACGDYGFIVLRAINNNGYLNGYTVVYSDSSTPTSAATDRWCMDVHTDSGTIVAVFNAEDDSELRVYSSTFPMSVSKVFSLTDDNGIDPGARAMAVECFASMAYVAMGTAGIYRVDTTEDPSSGASNWLVEGPLSPTSGCSPEPVPPRHFVYDLDFVRGSGGTSFLYAGADGWGLVEIDLSQTWDHSMSFWYSNSSCYWSNLTPNCSGNTTSYYFASRVAAINDATNGEIVIAMSAPKRSTNILTTPYTTFGTLNWDLGHVDELDDDDLACEDSYLVFTRPSSGSGTPSEIVAARHSPQVFFATPIHLIKSSTGSDFWLLDAPLQVAHLERVSSVLTFDTALDCGVYTFLSSPITPLAALNDPDVLLSGVDGGTDCAEPNNLYRVDPGTGNPEFEPIAPATGDDDRFVLKAFGVAQWIDSNDSTYEFLFRGKGGQADHSAGPPNLFRIDASSDSTLQALKRVAVFWEDDPLSMDCSSPAWTDPAGRGYGFTAWDDRPGSKLVVETRSSILSGAWLFDTEELEDLMAAEPDDGSIGPTLVTPLVTHPELASSPCDPAVVQWIEDEARTLNPLFFDIEESPTSTRRVLGIAASFSLEDPAAMNSTWGRPQLAFFDVSGFTSPPAQAPVAEIVLSSTSIPLATAICLDAETVELEDPQSPGNTRQHTLVFVGGSEGFLSVFDVTQLFTTGSHSEVSADLEPNVFDGRGDVILQVDFRPEVSGNQLGYLHVGAKRLGMALFTVHDDGNGSVFLTRIGGFKTPGSFGGFQISTVNGKQRLIVADHFMYGLRAYGEY